MHNLHFILVKANSGEEACKQAENEIIDWGTDNNWRTMCGAVSQDNEIYNANDGRYEPKDTDYQTIEAINNVVSQWTKENFYLIHGDLPWKSTQHMVLRTCRYPPVSIDAYSFEHG